MAESCGPAWVEAGSGPLPELRRPRETRPYEHVPAARWGTVDFYTFWGYV